MSYKPISIILLILFAHSTNAMVHMRHAAQKNLVRRNIAEGIVGGVGGVLIGGSAGFIFTIMPSALLGSECLHIEAAQCTALLGSVYFARGAGGRVGLAAWAAVAGGAYLYNKKDAHKGAKKLIAGKS